MGTFPVAICTLLVALVQGNNWLHQSHLGQVLPINQFEQNSIDHHVYYNVKWPHRLLLGQRILEQNNQASTNPKSNKLGLKKNIQRKINIRQKQQGKGSSNKQAGQGQGPQEILGQDQEPNHALMPAGNNQVEQQKQQKHRKQTNFKINDKPMKRNRMNNSRQAVEQAPKLGNSNGHKSQKLKSYVAICTTSKDDHVDILEWVEFHRCQGVGHVYIYDDRSSPSMLTVLGHLVQEGFVTYRYVDIGKPAQIWAYNDCIDSNRRDHQWLVMMDTDEYLVLQESASAKDLSSFLSRFEWYGAVGVPWVLLGSSGHVSRPHGGVTRNYVACSTTQTSAIANDTGEAHYVKSIVNTDYVTKMQTAHYAKFTKHGPIAPDGEKHVSGMNWSGDDVAESPLQLFHYATKSCQDFEIKKCRGGGDGMKRRWDWMDMVDSYCKSTCWRAVDLAEQCFGKLQDGAHKSTWDQNLPIQSVCSSYNDTGNNMSKELSNPDPNAVGSGDLYAPGREAHCSELAGRAMINDQQWVQELILKSDG